MDLARPLSVISPTLDAEVLRTLAGADADFTTAQVHRVIAHASLRGIANTLTRLVDQGIVNRRAVGRAWLYALNREHLAAPHVIALSQQRAELISRIASHMLAWHVPAVFGAIFGSALRADHTAASDIDLFVVRPDEHDELLWNVQVEQLARRVTSWTGNDARILEMDCAQVLERGSREPVLQSILAEGIPVAGDHTWLATALTGVQRQ